MSVYSQVLRSTAIYSIAVFASRTTGFLLLPLYTRYLSPADYGVLELLALTMSAYSTLIGMRFADSLFYFYNRAELEIDRDAAVSTCFTGAALLSISAGLIALLAAGALSRIVFGTDAYAGLFRIMAIALMFSIPHEVGLAYIRLLNRPAVYVVASFVQLGLSVALNIFFLAVLGWGVAGILYGSLYMGVIMSVLLGVYTMRGKALRFDFSLFKQQLRYSVPMGISGLSQFAMHFGDRYFLRPHVSLAELGIYSLAYKMGMLVSYVQMPFDIHWRAQIFSVLKSGDGEHVYVRMCTYVFLVLSAAGLLLSLFIHPVLRVMSTSEFHAAAAFVPAIAAAYVLRGLSTYFRGIFAVEARTRRDALVNWVSMIVCLAAYAVFIPKWKLWGAVSATLLTFVFMSALSWWAAQRVRPFPFQYGRMFTIVIVCMGIYALFELMRPSEWVMQSLWSVVCALLFGGLLFVLKLLQSPSHNRESVERGA